MIRFLYCRIVVDCSLESQISCLKHRCSIRPRETYGCEHTSHSRASIYISDEFLSAVRVCAASAQLRQHESHLVEVKEKTSVPIFGRVGIPPQCFLSLLRFIRILGTFRLYHLGPARRGVQLEPLGATDHYPNVRQHRNPIRRKVAFHSKKSKSGYCETV